MAQLKTLVENIGSRGAGLGEQVGEGNSITLLPQIYITNPDIIIIMEARVEAEAPDGVNFQGYRLS